MSPDARNPDGTPYIAAADSGAAATREPKKIGGAIWAIDRSGYARVVTHVQIDVFDDGTARLELLNEGEVVLTMTVPMPVPPNVRDQREAQAWKDRAFGAEEEV